MLTVIQNFKNGTYVLHKIHAVQEKVALNVTQKLKISLNKNDVY